MYPVIPVLSFISAALALVPLIWYLQVRNIAAMAIGIWLSITTLIHAVDALVWADDVAIAAPAWCDISTTLITGSRVAVPAACLSICIHLERLASFSQTSTGSSQAKRRRIIFECLMCFGLPVVYTALHLIVQPRRFDLFYGFGCRPATFPAITTIFLVIIPPLMLTVATIFCAGVAWRHFLVHGVQFHGKRSSISSVTRSLYLRLIGMALLEGVLSAILITVEMYHIIASGLVPMGRMSRNLSEVVVWGPDAITNNIWTGLEVEWSMNVIQSVVFFGLFACRTEIVREGWEQIRLFLGSLKKLNPSVMLGRVAAEESFTSASMPTLPLTVVDLSLVTQSASTFTPRDYVLDKCVPETAPSASRRPSLFGPQNITTPISEEIIISAFVPKSMMPLESSSRASAIASSHNSLESNFDPSLLEFEFSPEKWPETPTTVPIYPPVSLRGQSFSIGCIPRPRQGESWLEGVWEVPLYALTKPAAAHIRPSITDMSARRPGMTTEKRIKRQAICVAVVKGTHY